MSRLAIPDVSAKRRKQLLEMHCNVYATQTILHFLNTIYCMSHTENTPEHDSKQVILALII